METKTTTIKRIIILTIIITGIIIGLKSLKIPYNEIKNITTTNIIIITLLTATSSLINGYRIKYFEKIYKYKITHKDSYALAITNALTNFIAIGQSGLILKAYYLKKKCKLQLTNFISMTAATAHTQFLIYTILGIISLTLTKILYNKTNIWITLIFIIFATTLTLFYIPTTKIKSKNKYLKKLKQILDGWNRFKQKRANITGLLIIELTYITIAAIRLIYTFHAFNIKLPIIYAIILICGSNLAIILNIFNWLGFGEITAIWISYTLGLGITKPTNIFILLKLLGILTYTILGTYFTTHTINQLTTKTQCQKQSTS